MFRDTQVFESISDRAMTAWAVADSTPSVARAAPLGEDEVGAVWHIYVEIGRRLARNAYTRHAGTLGDAAR
jgi:hypothetical protein